MPHKDRPNKHVRVRQLLAEFKSLSDPQEILVAERRIAGYLEDEDHCNVRFFWERLLQDPNTQCQWLSAPEIIRSSKRARIGYLVYKAEIPHRSAVQTLARNAALQAMNSRGAAGPTQFDRAQAIAAEFARQWDRTPALERIDCTGVSLAMRVAVSLGLEGQSAANVAETFALSSLMKPSDEFLASDMASPLGYVTANKVGLPHDARLDIANLTALTFLREFRDLRTQWQTYGLDHAIAAATSWICTCARHASFDLIRRSGAQKRGGGNLPLNIDDVPASLHPAYVDEDRANLDESIVDRAFELAYRATPSEDRPIIDALYQQPKEKRPSQTTVAAQLGCPRATVQRANNRFRDRNREYLRQLGYDGNDAAAGAAS